MAEGFEDLLRDKTRAGGLLVSQYPIEFEGTCAANTHWPKGRGESRSRAYWWGTALCEGRRCLVEKSCSTYI
jgi:hypothetical protein